MTHPDPSHPDPTRRPTGEPPGPYICAEHRDALDPTTCLTCYRIAYEDPWAHWITAPGRYELSDREYHLDPVDGGSLSSTGARLLLPPKGCPAKFRHALSGGQIDRPEFDFGRAAHTEVLGVGAATAVITGTGKDPGKWATADDKAAVAAARAAGLNPLHPQDVPTIAAMGAALRAHPIAGKLFARPGDAEVTFVARDPETEVMCRCRVDWLPHVGPDDRPIIVDYKTTGGSSDPDEFAGSLGKFGYHIQALFYADVLRWLDVFGGRAPHLVLVVQEKDPPHLVTVGSISDRALQWGKLLARKARHTYAACMAADDWPGYDRQVGHGATPVAYDIPNWLDWAYTNAYDAGAFELDGDMTP